MKSKYHSIHCVILFLLLGQNLVAQLGLSPNPSQSGQCPGVARTYTFVNLDEDCGDFNVTIQSGDATINNVDVENG